MTLHASAFLDFQTTVRSYLAPVAFALTFGPVTRFPSVGFAFLFDKADVSKVIEARDPGELTKEAIDAKLSIF